MKKLVKYSCILMLAFAVSSCEDVLDGSPESFIATETFYNNIDEAEIALNGAYSVINANNVNGVGNNDTFGGSLYYVLNGGTDEMIDRNQSDRVLSFSTAAYTGEESQLVNNWYFWYAGINAANVLIDRVPLMVASSQEEEIRKNEIIAEATFLRGIYHMYLAKMFGAIPVNTTPIAEPNQGRQSLEIVYTQIIEDLQYAYNNLNETSAILGRANKWVAGAYLAKTYCYLGSSKMNNVGESLNFALNSFQWVDANDIYTKALTILNSLETESGYVLIDEYDRLFRETTAADQRKECFLMAEGTNQENQQATNYWFRILLARGNGGTFPLGAGPTDFVPTGELYLKYDEADIRRDHNLTRGFANNSPTEMIDEALYYVPLPVNNVKNDRFYSQGKFRQLPYETRGLARFNSAGNFPLLRFADVLLLKAEAQYYTGDETGARTTISKVRLRAAGNDVAVRDALDIAYNKADFIEELLDERSRELCFECQRRFDLVRFGRHESAIEALEIGVGKWNTDPTITTLKGNWVGNEFKMWFPIPKTQTVINPNLLPNNPGY
ncbi:RagB/SusD family nutrient uptake outer membrane protein [uncultured Algibacter sp.]|uniref:RagB/SusD family nutrient uptake outer membrane protein n=1 Tax=uncultured Algibacter sp. TaxID=298659 RepID=UPI00262C1BD8|nr:RagB/SusD family nutrient uptake outer membrane protein [uncultured Algibacter sp.]